MQILSSCLEYIKIEDIHLMLNCQKCNKNHKKHINKDLETHMNFVMETLTNFV